MTPIFEQSPSHKLQVSRLLNFYLQAIQNVPPLVAHFLFVLAPHQNWQFRTKPVCNLDRLILRLTIPNSDTVSLVRHENIIGGDPRSKDSKMVM